MAYAGWKWFCTKCGFEHYAEKNSDECPKCFEWNSLEKVNE